MQHTNLPNQEGTKMSESQTTTVAGQAIKPNQRAQFIDGIRALADFLETHPQVDLPYSLCASVYTDAKSVRKMTHLSGTWTKKYNDYNVSYVKPFTNSQTYSGSIRLVLSVERSQVCERVQVGTKTVEAVPAHEAPVYEWRCADSEADSLDA
jgi:hypothetical protein